MRPDLEISFSLITKGTPGSGSHMDKAVNIPSQRWLDLKEAELRIEDGTSIGPDWDTPDGEKYSIAVRHGFT